MRATFKTVFYVNASKEKNGVVPIMGRVTINGAFAKRVGKDRSMRTYQKYLTVRKYVAEFIKAQYRRSDISMNELTEDTVPLQPTSGRVYKEHTEPHSINL